MGDIVFQKGPLHERLRRRRLISYESLRARAREEFRRARYGQHVIELYEHVFGHSPEAPNIWNVFPLEEDIVWRLQEGHFPLDFEVLNQAYQYADPEALAGPIPIEGFGIDAIEEGFDYIREPAQPLVALLHERLYPTSPASDWVVSVVERIRTWWPDDAPHDFAWVNEHSAPQKLLARLDPPLDGLAVEYRCIVREDGDNIFLRHAMYGAWDVLAEEDLFWHPDTIDRLTREWRNVQPALKRLDAYHDWFHDHDAPVAASIEAFTRVEELYLEEQQGK